MHLEPDSFSNFQKVSNSSEVVKCCCPMSFEETRADLKVAYLFVFSRNIIQYKVLLFPLFKQWPTCLSIWCCVLA
ncbi:hypothetical protein EB796_007319 [Bugula neritina]|uniref:Uncharacterized protein n=1 Tax=Bugula neritina TaxID=10212 RepID=A0A7J7K6X6_BUGNE|nr:hypothetical protein EB796_007319 [Bugula neritina]